MERRVILSFILSFVVLILWQAIFPTPKKDVVVKSTQVIENKEVTNKQPEKLKKDFIEKSEETKPNVPEKTVTIGNDKIDVVLSTNGGVIVNSKIKDYNASLPIRGMVEIAAFKGLPFSVEKHSGEEVVFIAKDKGLEIRKIYTLSDGEHMINADIQIKNTGKGTAAISPDIQAMIIDVDMMGDKAKKGRDRNLMEYSVLSDGKVVRKTGAYRFTEKDDKKEYSKVEWFGFRNRYYCTIFKPNFSVQGYQFATKNNENLQINAILDDKTLSPGETASFASHIYIGPQRRDLLSSYGMDFEKIQAYFRLGFFDAIAKIIEDLIKFVHKIIPNWGVSIIIVSLLIYFSFYPLTMKSMLSMRKMQGLQPKIMELREKYEKNPQKLNQEIMKLYAENKVNPLGGCLPLLLQMPIFICLYQMIWRSVLFKGAGFLWIKDLSQPDRLMILDKTYPVIGNEVNILPLVILVLMFIQQKMTAKNMNSTDPKQIAQQKMMTFMMPALLFFVFYHIASGLTLYFTVFYIVSSFTQWRIGKKVKVVG